MRRKAHRRLWPCSRSSHPTDTCRYCTRRRRGSFRPADASRCPSCTRPRAVLASPRSTCRRSRPKGKGRSRSLPLRPCVEKNPARLLSPRSAKDSRAGFGQPNRAMVLNGWISRRASEERIVARSSSPPSKLPALLRRTESFADRHLAHARRDQLAGLSHHRVHGCARYRRTCGAETDVRGRALRWGLGGPLEPSSVRFWAETPSFMRG
jgi:hypothetical protein